MTNQFKAWCCSGLLALAMFAGVAANAACTYTLSTTSRNHGYGATNNSVIVDTQAGCTWNVASQDAWITIQPGWGGVGSNVVNYSITANTNTIGRTGTVIIASQTFTIRQDQLPCDYSLFPGSRSPGRAGGNSSFDVTATLGCSWTATNLTPAWITLTGNTNGTGTGNPMPVTYHVATNPTPVWRTGYVAVATETYVISQNPAPCIWELSPTNTNRGNRETNGTVLVLLTSGGNCSWVVQNTNAWIVITNLSGIGDGSFNYQVLSNSSSISRTGTVTVWGKTFLVTQGGSPCSGSISPSSSSPGAEQETRVVDVSIAFGCSWGVTNTNSWITVQPMSGTSSGPVDVIIAANGSGNGRTGTVSIAGQNYTVRQDGAVCTYKLSDTNRTHGYGATNKTIGIDTLSVCFWTVQNTNSWLTFAATSGTGDSNITYYVQANPFANDRSGNVLIGGQRLFVTQRGIGCDVTLSPTNRNHGYSAKSTNVIVTTGGGCAWSASTTNSWITLGTNGGIGSNQLDYAIAANPFNTQRIGYITVDEAVLTLTQGPAPCTNGVVPVAVTNSPLEEIGSVAVFGLAAGCTLNIANTNSWITIISGEGATGDTNVIYQVATNITGATRSGYITIGSENFRVTQRGVSCNYKLSPSKRTHGPGAATDTLSMAVSNPCPWSVINTNPWIQIVSNASGFGPNTNIVYTVDPNPVPFERYGWIEVEGQTCVITQRAANCTFSIGPRSSAHGYGGTSNYFTIRTLNGCQWFASTTNSWITIASGFGGTNTDDIGYTIEANTNFSERIGYILADSQTFTITQRAAACSFSLSPTNRNHGYAQTNNTIFVDTSPGCGWFVQNTNSWITFQFGTNGTGTGTVSYIISSNLDAAPRVGSFLVGDKTFTITQAQYLCSFKLSPENRQHGFGQTNRSVTVIAGPTCSWSVSNTNDWIFISETTGTNFSYTVYPNYGATSRTGLIFVADETFTITQLAATNGLRVDSLLLGGGQVTLKLNGGPPGIWEIYSSTNLTTWQRIGYATNTTGKVDFQAPAAGTNRFYKAFLP